MMKKGSEGNWKRFKSSFMQLDRRFIYVALLELLLIILLFSGTSMWSKRIMSFSDDIEGLQSQMDALGPWSSSYGMQLRDEVAVEMFTTFLTATAMLIVFILLVWSLIKYKIYNLVNSARFSGRVYWRFLVMSVLWGVVSFIVFMFLQFALYVAVGQSIDVSYASRFIAFIALSLVLLVLYWFAMNLFTHLVREGRILASLRLFARTALGGFGRVILPMLLCIAVMVLVNIVMFVFLLTRSGWLFGIVSTILLVSYFTWVRFYFTGIIGPREARAAPAAHAKGSARKKR